MTSCCYECCRKPWYKRAMEISSLWKSISWSSPTNLNTTISRSTDVNYPTTTTTLANPNRSSSSTSNSNNNKNKLKKCASLRVASSFTRVCLCAPISSYNEVLRVNIPPRRSNSYPRSSSSSSSKSSFSTQERFSSARLSMEGKRVIFRGKSLMDDVLMRRFVVEEEAMTQIRRRNQMEVIRRRRRDLMTRKKIGPSPLSRMVMAKAVEDEHYFN